MTAPERERVLEELDQILDRLDGIDAALADLQERNREVGRRLERRVGCSPDSAEPHGDVPMGEDPE